MKSLFVCLALFGFTVSHLACGKNISPTSSSTGSVTGTQTPSSTPTPSVQFQAAYQNSVYPNSSYSGETDAWLSGTQPSIQESASPYLQIDTVNDALNYGLENTNGATRSVVKFTGINLPTNSTIIGAEVWFKTETATSVCSGNAVTIGIHTFSSSIYNPSGSSCMPSWTTTNVDWDGVNGTVNWSSCDGSAGVGGSNFGMFNPTANSTCVFPSSISGTSQWVRFFLTTSDIQNEISSGSVQFVVRSEGEFLYDTSGSTVALYPNTDNSGNAPKLLISYQ